MKAIPIVIIAVGLALCYLSNTWNIGAEGQFLVGAICSAGVAIWLGEGAPAAVALPVVILAGGIGGAIAAWNIDSSRFRPLARLSWRSRFP